MESTPSPEARDARATPSPTQLLVVVVILAMLAAGLAAALLSRGSADSPKRAAELFLEPADDAGPNPFTPNVAEQGGAVTTTSTTPPAGSTAGAIASVAGSREGLYGGTMRTGSCNSEQLIDFLERNPEKAAAWASVQGIRPDRIRAFVAELTPVVLLRDTRVTNHGFVGGRATPRQAVLQAGTAVLVDRFGVPRVKCYCGNPLGPPRPLARPVVVGTPWPGYQTTLVVVVVAQVQVETFVLVDLETGQAFGRPAGTDGVEDVPFLEDGDAGPGDGTTAPGDPGVTATPPATPTGTYSVAFSGEQLTPPCSPWGAGTGSMEVTVTGASVAITLHGLGGTVTEYAGAYDPDTGAFSAPETRYQATTLTGTFTLADGPFTVPDGRSNGQSVSGNPCNGAFTAAQEIG